METGLEPVSKSKNRKQTISGEAAERKVGLTIQEGVHLFKWKTRRLSGHTSLQKGP